MSDSDLENRLTDVEQRQQRQDQVVAQIHEILLLLAQRQQQTEQTLDRTAAQQETNTRAIADLQAILRDSVPG
ncbi:MAG: hypothetical protein KME42_03405 [Tildeniella nuda ZEHNDER 1965/U140]|jgi:uncharacterized coiled-coil protein SlyX|nr:hypothetical protein [Tildeniella nuda ZEHNDER 1965/U140]